METIRFAQRAFPLADLIKALHLASFLLFPRSLPEFSRRKLIVTKKSK